MNMKKLFLILTLTITPNQALAKVNWQEIAKGSFMVTAGSWLAHKQIPRITGAKIEPGYSANGTKALATIFFAIGASGVLVGIYLLTKQINQKN
jgi:uncharacterized membrane protein